MSKQAQRLVFRYAGTSIIPCLIFLENELQLARCVGEIQSIYAADIRALYHRIILLAITLDICRHIPVNFVKRHDIKETIAIIENVPGNLLYAKPVGARLVKNKKYLLVVIHRIRIKKDR